MEIEYAYNFWDNFMPVDIGMLRVYLWFIPGYFLVKFLKYDRSITNLLLLIGISVLFIAYEYNSINSRFEKIIYTPSNIQLQTVYGKTVSIQPNEVQSFWSISIGKSGGYACYLLINSKIDKYRSVNVIKHEHSCRQDAKALNAYYKKI